MKRKGLLFVSIFLFIVSTIISLIGILENNNTSKTIGIILLGIVGLFNFVRGLIGRNEGNK